MDVVQSILLGLLTNGLTSFIAQFAQRDSRLLLGKNLYNKIKWEQTALEPILQKATSILVERIEWQETPSLEIVCLFLSSPEAEAIIRQIYAAQFLESEAEANWSSIQKEFLASFYLFTTAYPAYADIPETQLIEPAKHLLKLLVNGCEQVLAAAIDNGVLAAHEAKAVFRHRMLLEEFALLQQNVTFLTTQQKPNIQAILEFERKYRQQVGERHRYIIPPNFGIGGEIGELRSDRIKRS